MNKDGKTGGLRRLSGAVRRNPTGWIAIAAGVVLIAVGCLLGQPDSVLAKAIRICLECVGIG